MFFYLKCFICGIKGSCNIKLNESLVSFSFFLILYWVWYVILNIVNDFSVDGRSRKFLVYNVDIFFFYGMYMFVGIGIVKMLCWFIE